MLLLTNIKKKINSTQMLAAGDKVVVGFSGGPDSTALLHALWQLQNEFGFVVVALHVNHQLRGDAAAADAAASADFCGKYKIPFTLVSVDAGALARSEGLSVEDAARRVRHQALAHFAQHAHCNRIALGHTRDDQGETVLLRLMRGSGVAGLAAMQAVRPDGIIRPMLDCRRQEVLDYCTANSLSYCTDQSNLEEKFQRNRLRLRIIPLLRGFNPAIEQTLAHTAEIMSRENEQIKNQTAQASYYCLADCGSGCLRLNLARFACLGEATRYRVAMALFARLGASTHLLDYCFLQRFVEWATSAFEQGFSLPPKLDMYRKDGYLWLWSADTVACFCPWTPKPVQLPGRTPVPFHRLSMNIEQMDLAHDLDPAAVAKQRTAGSEGWQAFIDGASLIGKTFLRPRLTGEKIHLQGSSGAKKIKEIMSEAGVPPPLRDSYPVLADEGGPIWLPGFRIAHRVALTDNSRQIWRITMSREE
jgi:tRNA(Ile)-lysidine synthase